MVTSTNKNCCNNQPILQNNNFLQQLKKYITLFTLAAFYIPQLYAQNPIGIPGTAGDFEIDANFKVNNNSLKDWRSVLTQSTIAAPGGGFYVLPGRSTVAGENAVWIIDGNSGVGTEKEVLSTGSNKNGNPIGLGQSPYSIITVNPSTPQKNDLTNIYARSIRISGHRWIQLAAETRSVDGTSYLDFEYNQAGTSQTNTQLIGLGPDAGRTAKKIVNGETKSGDLLFVVDFSKGGNSPVPEVYEWQASSKSKSGFDWVKLSIPASTFIVTNGSDIETAGENSGFKGDGTASNITLALQFVEIGVDLTDLGIVEDNVCNPNATLTAKTRTSSSYTSELKDFNSFKFALVPAATLDVTAPSATCVGSSAEFTALVVGDGALATNVRWYKVTGTAPNEIETEITVGITTNTSNGQKSILTISSVALADAGNYRAKLSGASCGSPADDASLTVNSTATLTDLDPQVKCPGTSATATFSTTVGGTGASAANVEWYYGANKIVHDGVKYTISTNGATSTLLITGITKAGDEGTYSAKLTGATCGTAEESNTLTVNPVPVANAGDDPADQCFVAAGNTFTLDGTGSTNGNPVWTVVSKPTDWTVEFLNGSSTALTASIKVTGTAAGGKVVLKLTMTSGETPSCGNDEDEVEVEIKAQPEGPDAVMLPITCTDKFFKVKVSSPEAGVTYTLTQPGNSKEFDAITAELDANDVVKDVIFEGLIFGDGYSIIATIGDCSSAPKTCPVPEEEEENTGKVANNTSSTENIAAINSKSIKLEGTTSKVSAAPNPFNNTIRFKLESNVSGRGSLELYNTMGQKVSTVFNGYIMKGQMQTIDYNVTSSQRTNLIWVFSVGNERTTGKLIGLK